MLSLIHRRESFVGGDQDWFTNLTRMFQRLRRFQDQLARPRTNVSLLDYGTIRHTRGSDHSLF